MTPRMYDLVQKLKQFAKAPPADANGRIHASYYPTPLMLEAADEIEKLRARTSRFKIVPTNSL